MVKRHIEETVEEFDKNGTLVSRTTTITDEEDDSQTVYQSQLIPCGPAPSTPVNKTVWQ